MKSRGEDHMASADLLKTVVALDENGKKALNHLMRIIEQKNLVSYSGEIYTQKDVDLLWKYIECYRRWALLMLD